jgi:drug/metabolite transporter (DMT)-like permease
MLGVPDPMSIPLFPLLLVVASSLGWAACDLLRKLLVREIPPVTLVFLLTIGTAPLFAVWTLAVGASLPGPGYWTPALASVLLNIFANLFLLQGMRIVPLSVSVPLLSLTPVFAALLAIPLLGERPSPAAAAGILMVIAGAIWLHWQPRAETASEIAAPAAERERERRRHLKGAVLVGLTSLLWAMTIPLDKMALTGAAAPLHGTVLNLGVAAGVLLVLLGQRRLGELAGVRRVPGIFALALIVSCLALGLQLMALPLIFVGTVETLKRGIGNFMAMISGWIFFREAVTLPKALALVLMAIGVGLILS